MVRIVIAAVVALGAAVVGCVGASNTAMALEVCSPKWNNIVVAQMAFGAKCKASFTEKELEYINQVFYLSGRCGLGPDSIFNVGMVANGIDCNADQSREIISNIKKSAKDPGIAGVYALFTGTPNGFQQQSSCMQDCYNIRKDEEASCGGLGDGPERCRSAAKSRENQCKRQCQ